MPFVLLDAGDFVKPPGEPDRLESETMVLGMRRLGLVAVNVGPLELAWSRDDLRALTRSSGLPFLAGNVTLVGEESRPFPAWRQLNVRLRDGRSASVAVVGLADLPSGAVSPDFALEDPQHALGRLLPAIRTRCDLVVLLFAGEPPAARALAEANPEIDVVFGAGAHLLAPERAGNATVVFPGRQGLHVARVDVRLAPGARPRATAELVRLAKELAPDPGLERLVRATVEEINRRRGPRTLDGPRVLRFTPEVLSKLQFQLAPEGEAPSPRGPTCRDCHSSEHAAWHAGPHARAAPAVGCAGCHGDLAAHRADPAAPFARAASACEGCHVGSGWTPGTSWDPPRHQPLGWGPAP